MDRSWNRLFVWIFGILGLMVYLPVAGSGQSGPQSGLIPGRNINMVSGTTLPGGDPYLQRQNEGSVAHSTRNPMHLMGGANDYRTIDIPGLPADQETGDAWLGLFKSFDGGQSWQSTLLPGYPQDTSPAGLSSPLRGFKAAADPTVRAGAHGMFFYSGIVFDRSLNSSAVFVARFIDLNNREGVSFDVSNNRDPIKYLDVKVIESGTSGQFLDKTWLAVDIPRPGARTISLNVPDSDAPGGSVQQSGLACGNVYVAYANFTGETKKNVRTKVMVARSLDCGTTWEKPIMVDESWHISQGTTLAIDPSNGDVYVAWRQFQTSSNADGIVVAKSTDGGRRFSKAVPVALIPFPADQPTLPQTGLEDYRAFRTSAFPTMAVDSQSRIYVAWSQRDGSTGLGRVYMATSTDGAVWSTPLQIEPGVTGGQFMPALVFGGGKLTLLYYDLRHDLNPIYPGGLITDVRPSDDQLWHPPMLPLGRHTVDVRAAQFEPGQSPPFSSVRVSQYYSIIRDLDANPVAGGPAKVPVWQPLQFNPPNYPLFALGTKPFMSDYVDLTASPGMMYRNGAWRFNVDEPVDLHGVWTDNRDVVPPAFPWDWTAYVPPGSGAPCSTAGMRNQNIYTARLTPGMVVGTMGNSKDLYPDKFSSFVVFVQNLTNGTKSYHLSVSQPAGGGEARFSTGNGSLDIGGILPHEGLVRTVLVRSSNRRASVTVTVTDTTPGSGGLARKVVLNPDPSNPPLLSVSNGFET
ncbi:MAG: exo-alpha-sialidase, partial [Acidobacteria bacterium]|nr:exo-alpha-sialidase [Acidobacteriota bacterium]